jgi:excisionase family DNA binding protein
LTPRELASSFSKPAWGSRFPPILTVDQAAELLQVPKQTIYDWHSRELLRGCCRRVGKHLRFFRDRLLLHIFNEGMTNKE